MIKYIKRGDRKPYVKAALRLIDGNTATAYDLSSSTVRFILRKKGEGVAAINVALSGGELVDVANGQVQYQWQSGDTDILGDYHAEFEVTTLSGEKLTFWDLRTISQIRAGKYPEQLTISIVSDLD